MTENEASTQLLPPLQKLYIEYKPKLKELTGKYPRVSCYVDDPVLAANMEDILSKAGFLTQPTPKDIGSKALIGNLRNWLKNGDLAFIHYRPTSSGSTLVTILRELKRKAPFILNMGLIPIFMGSTSSSKQKELFRLLGHFGVRYCLFLEPTAHFDNTVERILRGLVEFNALLKNDFDTVGEKPEGEGAKLDTAAIGKYRKLLADGERLMKESDYEAAIKLFTEAIELKPDFNILIKRGDSFYKSAQYVAALNDYRYANTLEQAMPEPFAKVAACCFRLMKEPTARQNPERLKTMFVMGMKYLEDAEKLTDAMAKAHAHTPERLPPEPYAPLLAALVDIDPRGLGLTGHEPRFSELVSRIMDKTDGVNAENSDVDMDIRIDKAILLTRQGEYEEAEKVFRDIIKVDTEAVGPAFNNFAVELRKSGQYGKAMAIYEELLGFDIPDKDIVAENYKTAARRHAVALRDEMRFSKAVEVYDKLLSMTAKSKGREWILCDQAETYLDMQDQALASSRLMEAVYINPNIYETEEFKKHPDLANLLSEMMKKLTKGAL
jgi:tetratricopeptide (TPR) repeat protein